MKKNIITIEIPNWLLVFGGALLGSVALFVLMKMYGTPNNLVQGVRVDWEVLHLYVIMGAIPLVGFVLVLIFIKGIVQTVHRVIHDPHMFV